MAIADSVQNIEQQITAAIARRREKLAAEATAVKLVAVTKNHTVAAMREAIDAGVTAVGENRIQEAADKQPELARAVEWHLIGHLQTNKVRQAVAMFDLIHSVDSNRLAEALNKAAANADKRQAVLIQVNVIGEESKFGIPPEDALSFARTISSLPHLLLSGLMVIAPYADDPETVRPVFREGRNLFRQLRSEGLANTDIRWLSMGMTHDFAVAIEEGANLVRIGTAIFGARQY